MQSQFMKDFINELKTQASDAKAVKKYTFVFQKSKYFDETNLHTVYVYFNSKFSRSFSTAVIAPDNFLDTLELTKQEKARYIKYATFLYLPKI